MAASSGGKKKNLTNRNRQRVQLSFFIVVIFFAVFGIIVFAEVFLIDDHGRNGGFLFRHGTYYNGQDDYSDALQNADYISIGLGSDLLNMDNSIGALLMGNHIAAPVIDDDGQSSKDTVEYIPMAYPRNLKPSAGKWQPVNHTKFKFFVYSAFYDKRKHQRSIRVVGATKTRATERVWCRLWYRTLEGNTTNFMSRLVLAKIKVIRENWNLKYSACFVLCPVSNQTVPDYVSVVARKNFVPSNLIQVTNNVNQSSNKFAVCVKPLHFNFNRALQIVEFIELNRVMGVDHFTFYNHTIGPQVSCILDDYIKRGLVTLLPWQLNMVSQKEIRTEGLFAALNDCLYRSMYKYAYVALIDLDEFVIPRHNDSLPQLIDFISYRIGTRATGAFSFHNAFFYLQWNNDKSVKNIDNPIESGMVTLKKTRRKSKLHPHKQRSKYICRPEFVVEAGNHFVWEFIPGHGTFNVPPDDAILHHYRICEFGGDDCIKTSSTVDTSAFKYRQRLVSSVTTVFESLKRECKLEDIVQPRNMILSKIINILKSGEER